MSDTTKKKTKRLQCYADEALFREVNLYGIALSKDEGRLLGSGDVVERLIRDGLKHARAKRAA